MMVNTHEAKTRLSRLLEEVAAGKEVIIANAGRPVARLVPFDPPPREPGIAKGRLTRAFFKPLPDKELDRWQQ